MLFTILVILGLIGAFALLYGIWELQVNFSPPRNTTVTTEPIEKLPTPEELLAKRLAETKKRNRKAFREWNKEFYYALPPNQRPVPDYILHPDEYDIIYNHSMDGQECKYYTPITDRARDSTYKTDIYQQSVEATKTGYISNEQVQKVLQDYTEANRKREKTKNV